jgi:ribosomal protein L11 methyltransferase
LVFPALDVRGVDAELALAIVDDCSPSALEEGDGLLTIYFTSGSARDQALDALARACPSAQLQLREVDDEDWARRSQESLGPVTVGRITIVPPWHAQRPALPTPPALPPGEAWPQALPLPGQITVVIQPSMAFGTGHHATTRLCLVALQLMNLSNTVVLDVGTGSGILAIAARMLGAVDAIGIDHDPDALHCGRENLALNPAVDHVRFALGDVAAHGREKTALHIAGGPLAARPADVVVANLNAAVLCRSAAALSNAFAPGGGLILSGILAEERTEVVAAFGELDLVWDAEEEGWVGLGFARL